VRVLLYSCTAAIAGHGEKKERERERERERDDPLETQDIMHTSEFAQCACE